MSTQVVFKRWFGVALLVAVLALFSAVDLQAQNPKPVDVASMTHCFPDIVDEDEDPFASADSPAIDCPEFAAPAILSVEFTGNVAWATVAAGDGTELRVFMRKDGVWERFPYSSEPDPYWEYVFELEDAAMGVEPQPTIVQSSASSAGTAQGEAYEESFPELGGAATGEGVERLIERLNSAGAPQGEAYWEYMLKLEGEALGEGW